MEFENCHEPVKLNLLLYYYPNHITHYYLIRIAYQSPAYASHSITTRIATQPMTTLQYQLTRIQVIEESNSSTVSSVRKMTEPKRAQAVSASICRV